MQSRGFSCQYHFSSSELSPEGWRQLQGDPRLLALTTFAGQAGPAPVLATGLPLLHPDRAVEALYQWSPVQHRPLDGGFVAQTDDLLLVVLRGSDESMTRLSEQLYSRLLQQTRDLGYPHLVRIWNYLADINREDAEGERYRQFCVGRHNAFEQWQLADCQYPSACALGHEGDDLLVYALAARESALHFENPRQMSAYHYPPQHGPRSPSFARASLLQPPGRQGTLFVSGTASVLGHETRHPDDLQGQLSVTLENLDALLAHVAEEARLMAPLRAEQLKIYLRRAGDLPEVKAAVAAHFGPVPAVYLRSDICRRELLLEVEGTWSSGL